MKHGHSVNRKTTPTYNAWACIMFGPRAKPVCKQWAEFSVFLADMGKKPSRKHWLKAVDESFPLGPGNCIWSDEKHTRNRGHIPLEGQIFGRLRVISYVGKKNHSALWLCRCQCGNEKTVPGNILRRGESRSCGCLANENRRAAGSNNRTHGMTETATYKTWEQMIQRCTNPSNPHFVAYGGRGINICRRWLTFSNFYADMGQRPVGLSIDRWPDNDGNYEPGNCRWATAKQQANNRRKASPRRSKSA